MDIGKKIHLPKNGDYVLFNTIYHKKIDDDTINDSIDLIFKDMKTGEKFIRRLDNPEIEVYVAKPDVKLGDYVHIDIPKDDVDVVDVSYKNILRDLAKLIGQEKYYWDCIKQRRFDDLKRIQEYNRFFSSDRNIEDFYRYKCLRHLGVKELNNTTKGFLDIEADIKKGTIDFKTGTGSAPINAISLVDSHSRTVYTVILRDPDNPLIQELEDDVPNFVKELHDMYDEEFGVFNYRLAFFDGEVDLIKTIFGILNAIKLDFVMIWNLSFDIPYMMDRLRKHGIDPADVMCHPDFTFKECVFNKDKKNYEVKKKTDNFKCSSYTVYTDQMINYASIRKGEGQLDSTKLDYIGEKEVGARKLDYSDTASLRNLPYINFKMFIAYNIKDTLVQYKIEQKTQDIDTIFYRAYTSNTRYEKVFKEITFLTNVAFDEFEMEGVILGNNVNAIRYNRDEEENLLVDDGDDDDENTDSSGKKKKKKYKGAICGDPLLIMNEGLCLVGKSATNSIFNFVVDYDFTSLYPTILKMFNIYKSTLLGKIKLEGPPTVYESLVSGEEGYDRGAKFIEDLETKEPIFIGRRWLNLPSFEEVVEEFEKELTSEEKYRQVKVKRTDTIKKENKHKVHIRRKVI